LPVDSTEPHQKRRHILGALSFALQFLEPVHQNHFMLVDLDHETENDPLERRLRFRGKSNGWELNCGDENVD